MHTKCAENSSTKEGSAFLRAMCEMLPHHLRHSIVTRRGSSISVKKREGSKTPESEVSTLGEGAGSKFCSPSPPLKRTNFCAKPERARKSEATPKGDQICWTLRYCTQDLSKTFSFFQKTRKRQKMPNHTNTWSHQITHTKNLENPQKRRGQKMMHLANP